MATATPASTSSTTSSTTASTGTGADDTYTANGQSADGAADPHGDTTGTPGQGGTAASGGDCSGTAPSDGMAPPADDSRL
jgi:hypothetical protein